MWSREENRGEILGVPVDDISETEMNTLFEQWFHDRERGRYIVTPNPEYVLFARTHPWAMEIMQKADLSLADGVGIVFAAIALKQKAPNRNTGVDTIHVLLRALERCGGGSVMCIGGDQFGDAGEGALTKGVHALQEQYRNVTFTPIDPGRLTGERITSLTQQLKDVDCILIALPMKWQLKIMNALQRQSASSIVMGVGGAIDMIAGELSRAPIAWQKNGMEWLWRLIRQPHRLTRIYKATVAFPAIIARQALMNKHFIQSTKDVLIYLHKKPYGKY